MEREFNPAVTKEWLIYLALKQEVNTVFNGQATLETCAIEDGVWSLSCAVVHNVEIPSTDTLEVVRYSEEKVLELCQQLQAQRIADYSARVEALKFCIANLNIDSLAPYLISDTLKMDYFNIGIAILEKQMQEVVTVLDKESAIVFKTVDDLKKQTK